MAMAQHVAPVQGSCAVLQCSVDHGGLGPYHGGSGPCHGGLVGDLPILLPSTAPGRAKGPGTKRQKYPLPWPSAGPDSVGRLTFTSPCTLSSVLPCPPCCHYFLNYLCLLEDLVCSFALHTAALDLFLSGENQLIFWLRRNWRGTLRLGQKVSLTRVSISGLVAAYRKRQWARCADVVLPQEHLPSPAQAADEGCPALLPAAAPVPCADPCPSKVHLLVESRFQPCCCQVCCWVLLLGIPPAAAALSAPAPFRASACHEGRRAPGNGCRPLRSLRQGPPRPLFLAPCPATGCENSRSFALRRQPGAWHGLGLTDTGSTFSRNLFN